VLQNVTCLNVKEPQAVLGDWIVLCVQKEYVKECWWQFLVKPYSCVWVHRSEGFVIKHSGGPGDWSWSRSAMIAIVVYRHQAFNRTDRRNVYSSFESTVFYLLFVCRSQLDQLIQCLVTCRPFAFPYPAETFCSLSWVNPKRIPSLTLHLKVMTVGYLETSYPITYWSTAIHRRNWILGVATWMYVSCSIHSH
jgi:hypothetical protein